jgi:PAS domain S-box-containing protein
VIRPEGALTVLTLCIGSGPSLAMARALVTRSGHAVADALGADGAAEALARISTPELVILEAAGPASAAGLVRAVRSHVRGEAAALLALVPEEAVEAALGAGADLALPSPLSRSILAAAIASLGRAAGSPRAPGGGSDTGQDIYFLRNPNPMWFYDVDSLRFVAVNDAAVQKYGYSREEFLAMTIKEIRPPEELDRLLLVTRHVERGLNTTPGWRHRARDGRIFHVEIISYPVRYAGRTCELVLAHDVTERVEAARELEELRAQLTISDRMASIGTLASGVAHEINNPLTWIVANLAFAAEQLPAFRAPSDEVGRTVRDALLEAAAGARRVKTIVRDLKAFSRADEDALGPVELRAVVAASVGVAANELMHRAQVVVDVDDAPPVLANEARLGQVILNLIVNAAHAIPDGDAARQEIRITAAREGDRVSLVVSDTGPGIAPAIADRIFEPFFTTKPVGQGTGLGLWVCRRVLAALGGSIELLPSTGHGAAFRVLLPVAPAGLPLPVPVAASAAPAPGPSSARPGGRRRADGRSGAPARHRVAGGRPGGHVGKGRSGADHARRALRPHPRRRDDAGDARGRLPRGRGTDRPGAGARRRLHDGRGVRTPRAGVPGPGAQPRAREAGGCRAAPRPRVGGGPTPATGARRGELSASPLAYGPAIRKYWYGRNFSSRSSRSPAAFTAASASALASLWSGGGPMGSSRSWKSTMAIRPPGARRVPSARR